MRNLVIGFGFAACALSLSLGAERSPNVLFIAVDDLRPMLGCYGDKVARTPNIDRLASDGTVFRKAYCQQAVCSPSRLSLMTGRRPDTIRVWDLNTHFRKALPHVVTLPQFFRKQGYHCRSIGKIFHGGGPPSKDEPSWSEAPLHDNVRAANLRYATPENLEGEGLKRASSEAADVPDETYIDGMVCKAALEALDRLKTRDQPFFLAVGFRKPHLPFCAPRKYWDLYDRETLPAPASELHPRGAPEVAVRSWKELEGYTDISRNGKVSKEKAAELRHGYYACVSYVDALVGRLLDQIDALGLGEETVICLWGDHGFHLGEQGLWAKANNYELSVRVPLILSAPGQKETGAESSALVELVDLYPTLVESCGFAVPEGLQGTSFRVLLDEPLRSWKTAAFSQYPRAYQGNRHRSHGDIMGYSVRTDQHRYAEWRDWKSGEVKARELYDHETDPGEMQNVAGQERYAETLDRHGAILKAGWKQALP